MYRDFLGSGAASDRTNAVVYRNFLGSGAASDRTNAVRNSLTRSAGHHRMPPTS